MLDSNKIVHGLWIGTKLSASELLTIASFQNCGHEFHLWAYDEIETKIPENCILHNAGEIIPRDKVFSYKYSNQFGHGKGSYAGFSDIFRYKLLYEKGGWWTDMDVTCLKPLDFKEDYVFRTHQQLPLVGNIMKCPPKSELMKLCFEEASEKVTEENTDWHLPIEILCKNVENLDLSKFIKEISNPDSWNFIRKLLRKNFSPPPHWYVIHWVNEEWRRNKIDKNFVIKTSFFHKIASKNNIEINTLSGTKALKQKYKLSLGAYIANRFK
ncbi:MAG: hypothetical protein GX879_07385 [Bacteroidales bacterium]|nr:hypothetical protein [Bacteroidales bacterium]